MPSLGGGTCPSGSTSDTIGRALGANVLIVNDGENVMARVHSGTALPLPGNRNVQMELQSSGVGTCLGGSRSMSFLSPNNRSNRLLGTRSVSAGHLSAGSTSPPPFGSASESTEPRSMSPKQAMLSSPGVGACLSPPPPPLPRPPSPPHPGETTVVANVEADLTRSGSFKLVLAEQAKNGGGNGTGESLRALCTAMGVPGPERAHPCPRTPRPATHEEMMSMGEYCGALSHSGAALISLSNSTSSDSNRSDANRSRRLPRSPARQTLAPHPPFSADLDISDYRVVKTSSRSKPRSVDLSSCDSSDGGDAATEMVDPPLSARDSTGSFSTRPSIQSSRRNMSSTQTPLHGKPSVGGKPSPRQNRSAQTARRNVSSTQRTTSSGTAARSSQKRETSSVSSTPRRGRLTSSSPRPVPEKKPVPLQIRRCRSVQLETAQIAAKLSPPAEGDTKSISIASARAVAAPPRRLFSGLARAASFEGPVRETIGGSRAVPSTSIAERGAPSVSDTSSVMSSVGAPARSDTSTCTSSREGSKNLHISQHAPYGTDNSSACEVPEIGHAEQRAWCALAQSLGRNESEQVLRRPARPQFVCGSNTSAGSHTAGNAIRRTSSVGNNMHTPTVAATSLRGSAQACAVKNLIAHDPDSAPSFRAMARPSARYTFSGLNTKGAPTPTASLGRCSSAQDFNRGAARFTARQASCDPYLFHAACRQHECTGRIVELRNMIRSDIDRLRERRNKLQSTIEDMKEQRKPLRKQPSQASCLTVSTYASATSLPASNSSSGAGGSEQASRPAGA